MRLLQTILLEQAPDPTSPSWDLLKLKQQIVADESRARVAGESVGTKRVGSAEPQALAARAGAFRGRKDSNDPVWLAKQTCYGCGAIGHLRMNCMASSALREAHRVRRAAERTAAQPAANAATTESDSLAMVAEPLTDDGSIACAAQGSKPSLKCWIFDTGCTDHLNPNRSQFISYTPFQSPHNIYLGNSSLSPSLGIGTIELDCIMNGASVKRIVEDVQYVPGMIYGLLAGKCLN